MLTDRMDYLNPLGNNLAYCADSRKAARLRDPRAGDRLRVLLAELPRMSHLMFVGTWRWTSAPARLPLLLPRAREDPRLLRGHERRAHDDLVHSPRRPRAVMSHRDAGPDFRFIEVLPGYIDTYEELLTGNPIFNERTEGVGGLSADDALALGVSGPALRGSGVALDMRKSNPYCGYERMTSRSRRARLATATIATWCAWARCARA